jgi:hypothetical protein
MHEINIQLDYNPDYFRNIYYKNGQGSVFTYKHTKRSLLFTLASVLLVLVLYVTAFTYPVLSWSIFVSLALLLMMVVRTFIVVVKYFEWKKSIENYLRKIGGYQYYALKLSEEYFTFSQAQLRALKNGAIYNQRTSTRIILR